MSWIRLAATKFQQLSTLPKIVIPTESSLFVLHYDCTSWNFGKDYRWNYRQTFFPRTYIVSVFRMCVHVPKSCFLLVVPQQSSLSTYYFLLYYSRRTIESCFVRVTHEGGRDTYQKISFLFYSKNKFQLNWSHIFFSRATMERKFWKKLSGMSWSKTEPVLPNLNGDGSAEICSYHLLGGGQGWGRITEGESHSPAGFAIGYRNCSDSLQRWYSIQCQQSCA